MAGWVFAHYGTTARRLANGTEFHDYAAVEKATSAAFYFATPYHSWERGSNENFNGLLRQYLPKRASQAGVTQRHCEALVHESEGGAKGVAA